MAEKIRSIILAVILCLCPFLAMATDIEFPKTTLSHQAILSTIEAATEYKIPANILLAVAEKEGGQPGQWVRNTNGSWDVGPMQFNTAYLQSLRKNGIQPEDVAAPGSYPFKLAAWRIRQHLQHDTGDMFTRAANYHSRTPKYNAVYRADLILRAARWGQWLENNFATVMQQTTMQQTEDYHASTKKDGFRPYVSRQICAK